MIALSAANLTLKCGKSCTTRSVSLKEKCVFSFRGLILRINIEEKKSLKKQNEIHLKMIVSCLISLFGSKVLIQL